MLVQASLHACMAAVSAAVFACAAACLTFQPCLCRALQLLLPLLTGLTLPIETLGVLHAAASTGGGTRDASCVSQLPFSSKIQASYLSQVCTLQLYNIKARLMLRATSALMCKNAYTVHACTLVSRCSVAI